MMEEGMFLKVKAGRRELSLRRVLSAGPGCLLLAKVENIWARIIRFSRFFNWKLLSPNLFQTKSRVGGFWIFRKIFGGIWGVWKGGPTATNRIPNRHPPPRRSAAKAEIGASDRFIQVGSGVRKSGSERFFQEFTSKKSRWIKAF